MSKPYKIRIMRDAYMKLFFFVDKCDVEIGFMGKVKFNQAQMSYDILSVHVPEQEVTGSTTDLDASAVSKLDSDTISEPGHLNAWLHSHVNMGVFWSQTDRDTIKELGDQGLCVAVVVNKKKEMRGAIYWKGADVNKDDFYPTVPSEGFYDEVPIEVVDRMPLAAEWTKELETKVRKKTYVATYSSQYGHWCKETNKWIPTVGKNTGTSTPTTSTVMTGGGATVTATEYELKLKEFVAELSETCSVNTATGEMILSRKQKKRYQYLKERLAMAIEREKGEVKPVDKQLSLVEPGNTEMLSNHPAIKTFNKEELYTDLELFHMIFTELDAELRQMVRTGFITEVERTEVQNQWRTCNARIQAASDNLEAP